MSELNDGSGAQSKRRIVIKNPPYAPSDSAVNTYIDEEKADKGENVEGVDLEDVIRRDGWAYSKSVDSLLERWSVVREWVIRHSRRIHHLISTTDIKTLPPTVSSLISNQKPHVRVLLLLGLSALFLWYISAKSLGRTVSQRETTLRSLARNPEAKGLGVGERKARALNSWSNPYGFINLVDPGAGGVFNPSILVLPDGVPAEQQHFLVARGSEVYEEIDGQPFRFQKVLACFLRPAFRPHLNLPYLSKDGDLFTVDLPAQRVTDFKRCEEHTYDQFIGPEDPRLFWTDDGQPLLIYSQTGGAPMICRAIYIIDARVIMPGLKKHLDKAGWRAPIVFDKQTDLIREDQANIEKNWSPFLGDRDELHFHVNLVPQQIYKYHTNLTLRALDPLPPSRNCLTDVVGADMLRVKFHHATPLLRVTMCKRGQCTPNVHNTVLFGIIHVKYHPEPYLFYERRVVTWNVTSPFEYLSVSKPLSYMGTNQADPIFTVSMAWANPTRKYGLGLNHGFLDDRVLISFGVFDYGSAYIDVLVEELLVEHQLCPTSVRGLWS